MLSHSLDLSAVRWEAKHLDETTLEYATGTYEKINREQLDTFSLTFHGKSILELHPKNRTLVWRIKNRMQTNVVDGQTGRVARVMITALLAKPQSEESRQRCASFFDPKWEPQIYHIDKEESNIYYLYENTKIETRNWFAGFSPYTPLHLREEEFKHLMGIDDPTKRKIDS